MCLCNGIGLDCEMVWRIQIFLWHYKWLRSMTMSWLWLFHLHCVETLIFFYFLCSTRRRDFNQGLCCLSGRQSPYPRASTYLGTGIDQILFEKHIRTYFYRIWLPRYFISHDSLLCCLVLHPKSLFLFFLLIFQYFFLWIYFSITHKRRLTILLIDDTLVLCRNYWRSRCRNSLSLYAATTPRGRWPTSFQ